MPTPVLVKTLRACLQSATRELMVRCERAGGELHACLQQLSYKGVAHARSWSAACMPVERCVHVPAPTLS